MEKLLLLFPWPFAHPVAPPGRPLRAKKLLCGVIAKPPILLTDIGWRWTWGWGREESSGLGQGDTTCLLGKSRHTSTLDLRGSCGEVEEGVLR